MVRGFSGAPAIHMVHREPLRAEELDRQVIKGMTGFEFGTEDEVETKLVEILESEAYSRAVQHWERKRSTNNLNGNGARWGESVSNSSLAMSFDSKTESSGLKKSRRFSGFDYYRRKLFSPVTSTSGSPSSHSPPNSHRYVAHPSFSDPNREPMDPTKGFHPLLSMYYLAREKLERDRVYGPGQFASSQLSISGEPAHPAALAVPTPVDDGSLRQQQYNTATATNARKDPLPSARTKADYSMPLPRLPAPETLHFSGMSYDNTVAPSPTSPSFAQPRARDPGLPPPSPSAVQRQHIEIDQSALGPKRGLPRAPPPSTHRRSHSMSQRPTALVRGWGGMFGGGDAVDEQGVQQHAAVRPPEPPATAGPELTSFQERGEAAEREKHHDHAPSPFSSGATLVRKFGSMLVGGGRGDESRRHGTASGKRGTILGSLSPSPRPSAEEREKEKEKAAIPEGVVDDTESSPTLVSPAATKTLSQSVSQPIGNVHRRAATILDPQGRANRHERRTSTGSALIGNSPGGTIGRNRRPSTGYSSSAIRPITERLFSKAEPEPELAEKRDEDDGGPQNNEEGAEGQEETFKEEDERHTSEKDFKPIFLKGLFRYDILFY